MTDKYFPLGFACTGTIGWFLHHESGQDIPPEEGPYVVLRNARPCGIGGVEYDSIELVIQRDEPRPPRPAEDGMKWQKGWGSRGEWFWEEVKA